MLFTERLDGPTSATTDAGAREDALADAGTVVDADAGAPVNDLECIPLNATACENCCEDHHPDGADLFDKVWADCVCTPERCKTPCEDTECSAFGPDSRTGDACDVCWNAVAP